MTERDVFIEALQQSAPAARQTYLDAACQGDPTLRRRVEDLLQAHDDAGSFLEGTPADEVALNEKPPVGPRSHVPRLPGNGMKNR